MVCSKSCGARLILLLTTSTWQRNTCHDLAKYEKYEIRLDLDIPGVLTMLLCRGGQPDTISIELGVSYISFKTIYLESRLSIVWLRCHRKKKKRPSKTRWRLYYYACFYWQLLVFMA